MANRAFAELFDGADDVRGKLLLEAVRWHEAAELVGRLGPEQPWITRELKFPGPSELLWVLRTKLRPGGMLFIQVPDGLQNPFDLLVADHCTHFDVSTLDALITRCGFDVVALASDWVPKELSLIARPAQNPTPAESRISAGALLKTVQEELNWLTLTREQAQRIGTRGGLGVFGTSIAAAWLAGELGDCISFFVDEDQHRTGTVYMGKPVYNVAGVPPGSRVFLGLAPKLAESIFARLSLQKLPFELLRPPPA